VQPQRRSNLGSIDKDAALLFKLAAKYLVTGALEYCPPGHEPDNIIPLGLVDKKDPEEPFRIIADARCTNPYLKPWRSKMTGMKAAARLFDPVVFAFLQRFQQCLSQCAAWHVV
jgi:hypothetical protein